MSDDKKQNDPIKKGIIIFGITIIAFGILAVIKPDLFEGAKISGPLPKAILFGAWGRVTGIIAIIFGGLAIVGILLPDKEEAGK